MIKEAYVSFEVAKLLKEKGFNEPCYMSYWLRTKDSIELVHLEQSGNNFSDCLYAPTHQLAMAWLRDIHKIFIEIGTSIDLNGNYHFHYTILDKECKYVRKGYTFFDWTYEDAVETALKYCLENLI